MNPEPLPPTAPGVPPAPDEPPRHPAFGPPQRRNYVMTVGPEIPPLPALARPAAFTAAQVAARGPVRNLRGGRVGTPEPVRGCAAPAGRNGPCPCGSGRKYKKCHGGARGARYRPAPEPRYTGVMVFAGPARHWFPAEMAGHPNLAALRAAGAREQAFTDAPLAAVSAWRPDGWTPADEEAFRQWGAEIAAAKPAE